MEDEALIALFEARSEMAVPALAERMGPLCGRIARNILGSADAEECLNDTWLAVWNAIPPTHPQDLSAWVCRVTRNLALTRYAQARAQKRFCPYTAALDELAERIPDPRRVDDTLQTRELTAAIERFLDTLPQRDRVLFVRRYWYGDATQTLAEQLGCTQRAVILRLHRLRGRLRAALEKEEML